MEIEPTNWRETYNKNTLLWLLVRVGVTALIFSGCLSLISMANTAVNFIGVGGLLGLLYYWLPTKIQFDKLVTTIEDFFDEY